MPSWIIALTVLRVNVVHQVGVHLDKQYPFPIGLLFFLNSGAVSLIFFHWAVNVLQKTTAELINTLKVSFKAAGR